MKYQAQRIMHTPITIALLIACLHLSTGFSPVIRHPPCAGNRLTTHTPSSSFPFSTCLSMSDSGGGGGGGAQMEKDTSRKTGVQVITKEKDETETQTEEEIFEEEMWRVILHNDEVHTFNYVISILTKVIGTIDKKKAHDVCVLTHGQGQATVAQGCYKPQAMKYCLGMQRAGLTASIAPEGKFEGGSGGGEPSAG